MNKNLIKNRAKVAAMTMALAMAVSGTAVVSFADVQASKIQVIAVSDTTGMTKVGESSVAATEMVPAKDISKISFQEFAKDMGGQTKMTAKALAEAEKQFNLYKKEMAAKNYKAADQAFLKVLKLFGIEVEFNNAMSATVTATDTIPATAIAKPLKTGK